MQKADLGRPPNRPIPRGEKQPRLLSIVAPVYNEEDVLLAFEARVRAACEALAQPYELVLVNDGSSDDTLNIMHALRLSNPSICLVNLSRNFGKEIALTAGLDRARGDAVVVIDSDLQDPPELVAQMIAKWREGYDIVYARRAARRGETWFKKQTARMFYSVIRRVGPVEIPADTGDFRLLSRRVVDALGSLREHHRFMKGLFAWVGFPAIQILYDRDPRFAGATKWNYWKLWNLCLEGITSFTTIPLRVTTYVGGTVALLSFLYGFFFVLKTIFAGESVQGFPTIIIAVLVLGGLQLMALGVIGEYLGRVFNETKGRPLYIVESYLPAATEQVPEIAPVESYPLNARSGLWGVAADGFARS